MKTETLEKEVENEIKKYIRYLKTGKIEKGNTSIFFLMSNRGKTYVPQPQRLLIQNSDDAVDSELYIKTFISKFIELLGNDNEFYIPDDFVEHCFMEMYYKKNNNGIRIMLRADYDVWLAVENMFSPYYKSKMEELNSKKFSS